MANKFSSQTIENTLQTVIKKYHFNPEYLMSTSGEFLVMTLKRGQKKFLIKMRLNKSLLDQKKFNNEIAIIKYLQTKKINGLITPKIYIANTKTSPEYLIYHYIAGYPLNGFYISIGQRSTQNFLNTNFFNILKEIKKNKPPKNIKLSKKLFLENFHTFKTNENYLKKYISSRLYKNIIILLTKQKSFLNNTDLVLTHGDINPKNIVLKKRQLALIDWSEVHLNNLLFDLSNLYLFAWNRSSVKNYIKNNIFNNCRELDNPYHLFLLNRLILIPRNIRIMENSIAGIRIDKKNKIILPVTASKLENTAKQAIRHHVEEVKRITEYLLLWERPGSIVKSIETLFSFKSANEFIIQNYKKFGLNKRWRLDKIINHRLVIRQGDQKLITEYVFTAGKKNKIIMGKIRLERGDDLAKQSYQIINAIWKNSWGNKLISRPLYYFPKNHLYIYEKTLGKSIAELIEQKKFQTKKYLIPLIKQSAKLMSQLHQLPTKNFAKIKFYNNYDLAQQLKLLTKNINKHKNFKNKKNINLLRNLSDLQKKIVHLRSHQLKFIHGDFQLQNLILHQKKLKLIDFDNAEINDPLIDVGNFLNQINYKNLLYKNSYFLRQLFLQTYLKLTQQKLNKNNTQVINFYIIMGIVKNINLNFLENNHWLVIYDLKKIDYLYHHLTSNPIDNLREVKKILT